MTASNQDDGKGPAVSTGSESTLAPEAAEERPAAAAAEPTSLVSTGAVETQEENAAKPDAPASEVAEFQDAATSMGAMSSDVPPHPQAFTNEDQVEVEETIVEGRTSPRGARRGKGASRRGTARDILLMEVPERAARAHQNLREQLRGTVLVEVNDGRESYILDWRGDQPSVKEAAGETSDCTIRLHERELELIASGGLNPQIAMLSEKIKVSGNACFAMYFFNLIAPPAVH